MQHSLDEHWQNKLPQIAKKLFLCNFACFILFQFWANDYYTHKFFNALKTPQFQIPLFTMVFFALIILMRHSFLALDYSDDTALKHVRENYTLISYVIYSLLHWQSRIFSTICLYLVIPENDGLWRILDTLAFVLTAECIIELAIPKKNTTGEG